jgi:hypothetical protein
MKSVCEGTLESNYTQSGICMWLIIVDLKTESLV